MDALTNIKKIREIVLNDEYFKDCELNEDFYNDSIWNDIYECDNIMRYLICYFDDVKYKGIPNNNYIIFPSLKIIVDLLFNPNRKNYIKPTKKIFL